MRLSELGNELDELRGRERCLRQQSAQKVGAHTSGTTPDTNLKSGQDTFIAELRQEQRHLQKDLRRARTETSSVSVPPCRWWPGLGAGRQRSFGDMPPMELQVQARGGSGFIG